MWKLIKFEMYKFFHDPFLKVGIGISLLITIIMLSGTELQLEQFVQKSFIPSMIASLYAGFYSGYDFEDHKIIYSILSGNTRSEIVIAKFGATLIGTEILNLIFPVIAFFMKRNGENQILGTIFIAYVILGGIWTIMGILISWIFKRNGIVTIVIILFHMCTLLLMNGSNTSFLAMRTIPFGIVKMWIINNIPMYSIVILLGWLLVFFVPVIIVANHSEI